jgi:transcriptional antiterminator NusG
MTEPALPDHVAPAVPESANAPPAPADAPPPAPEAADLNEPPAPAEPPAEPAPAETGVAEEPQPVAEAEEPDAEEPEAAAEPEAPAEPPVVDTKRWYVVKVQSGREETIKEAIERKVRIEGLEEFYGEIKIPTEQVVEMRRGKRVKKERKLFPGYLMAHVEYNDRILYLFRETSGVGDFVGGTINRPPPPMSPREIEKMLGPKKGAEGEVKVVPTRPEWEIGDRVKVKDGAFAGMEGEVKEILEAKGQVRVEVTIFGRPVSLELEYWQVEQV